MSNVPAPARHSYVHFELYTDRPEATRAFYEDVFGWRFQQVPDMDYTTAMPPAPPDGGLLDRRGLEMPVPPVLAYIDVGELKPALERIQAEGGEVLNPEIDVPGVGRMAVFRAPGGIVQALWEKARDNPDPDRVPPDEPPAGAIVHVEMRSSDPAATQAFYEDVFGFAFEPAGPAYTTFQAPRAPHGGVMQADESTGSPSTLTYLLVEDAQAMVHAIEDAGGKLLEGPTTSQGYGTGAIVETPGGVIQGIWQGAA